MRCKKTGVFLKTGIFDSVEGNIETNGIYRITCLITGKNYYGSTLDTFKSRWLKHLNHIARGTHCNNYLSNAVRKHGVENFQFSILETYSGNDLGEIHQIEQYYLDNEVRWGFDYNLAKIAKGGYTKQSSLKICHEILDFYLSEECARLGDVRDKFDVERHTSRLILRGEYIEGLCSIKVKLACEKLDRTSLKKCKEVNHSNKKLTTLQVGQARWLTSKTKKRVPIADYFGINTGTLHGISIGRNYQDCTPVECPEIFDELNLAELNQEEEQKSDFIGKVKWLVKRTKKVKVIAEYFGCSCSRVTNVKGWERYGFTCYEKYKEIPCPEILNEILT